MNRQEIALGRLADRLELQAGRSVSVELSGELFFDVLAVPLEQTHVVDDGEGGFTRVKFNDWLVRPESIGCNEPIAGMTLTETIGSEKYVYEAVSVGKRPCFEWHDSVRSQYLIHTQRIE